MQPYGPLMVEHRLIERMVALMRTEVDRLQRAEELDRIFMETAVDFMYRYAGRTHHGKEEDILFRDLALRDLAADHEAMMHDLVTEHGYARDLTDSLVNAVAAHDAGDEAAVGQVVSLLITLTDFYPTHIEKEDVEFFPAAMEYLTIRERDELLRRFHEFDEAMIHEKYASVVETFEARTWRNA